MLDKIWFYPKNISFRGYLFQGVDRLRGEVAFENADGTVNINFMACSGDRHHAKNVPVGEHSSANLQALSGYVVSREE